MMSNIENLANEFFGEMRYSTEDEVAYMKAKYNSMSFPCDNCLDLMYYGDEMCLECAFYKEYLGVDD